MSRSAPTRQRATGWWRSTFGTTCTTGRATRTGRCARAGFGRWAGCGLARWNLGSIGLLHSDAHRMSHVNMCVHINRGSLSSGVDACHYTALFTPRRSLPHPPTPNILQLTEALAAEAGLAPRPPCDDSEAACSSSAEEDSGSSDAADSSSGSGGGGDVCHGR